MKILGQGLVQDLSLSEALGQLGETLLNPNAENDLSESLTTPDNIFEEEPVDVDTFLYDSKYLNLSIQLSLPQRDFVDNCSRIFDSPIYTEGVLQSGQGSGKDTCSVFLCLRLIYLLLCLKSPQKYFAMGDKSFIDIINIAPTEGLAKNIFFDTLVNYMKSSPYFDNLEVSPTRRLIEFPKFIRLHSSNSVDESWQGLTPMLIVLDEIDAFKSEVELQKSRSLRAEGAEGIHNTAKSLVQSRFPEIGKVLCLSWPRFKGSFIQKRFIAGKAEPLTYVPCKENGQPYATWEFNPARSKESFQEFYRTDPILAAARFECNPPFARDAFIKDPIFVLNAFDADLDELDKMSWGQTKNRDTGGIRTEQMLNMDTRYYIHVDLGLRQANAAVGIAHFDMNESVVVLDLIKVWEPQPGKDIILSDIEKFILDLRNKGLKIEECSYDGYQSVSAIQNLEKANINAFYKSVSRNREAYDTFRDLLFAQRIDGYYDEATIRELLGLDVVYNDKIEARPGGLKDRADAIVGAIHGAMKGQANRRDVKDVGELGSMFASPTTKGDDSKNISVFDYVDGKTGRAPSTLKPKLTPGGFIEVSVACVICGRIGSMEFSGPTGRVMSDEEGTNKWCMLCKAGWDRPTVNEEWIQSRESDDEALYLITRG